MKRLLLFFTVFSAIPLLFIGAVWYLNDGFSLGKIHSDLAYNPQWNVTNPPKEVVSGYLSQNFYYLGKGSQCFVFESEDKQIVLKFFRHSRYRLSKMYQFTGHPNFLAAIQNQKKSEKEIKLKKLFSSCKLAYEELGNETGLLYLHLNATRDLKKSVVIFDKLKRPYPIDMDDYTFIIQKHGEQILPYFSRLLKKGKKEEAERALADLTALIATRLSKGIVDRDAVIHKNSGFQANKAFFIDVGAFEKKSISHVYQELRESTYFLQSWLQTQDPDLSIYFEHLLSSYVSQENLTR